MIRDLDTSIEKLLMLEFGSPLPFKLSFDLPDRSFKPAAGATNTLNCYLYDIHENRDLRTVEPIRERQTDGTVRRRFPPARVQLSYCITAWSPAVPPAKPTLDEHDLLSQVLQALLKYPELPDSILAGTLAGQLPPLPTTVILPDGTRDMMTFWTALGGQLRPLLDYRITLSLAYRPVATGPMVTTQFSVFTQSDVDSSSDELIQIGGVVTNNASPKVPLPDVWVLESTTRRTAVTDSNGRFVFSGLRRGPTTLHARAVGFKETTRAVNIPEFVGDYNLILLP